LLDQTGHVRWSYNGEFDAERYRELKDAAIATRDVK
jgi:hypothetical protein